MDDELHVNDECGQKLVIPSFSDTRFALFFLRQASTIRKEIRINCN
jgi:hypothetical protein